MLYGALGVITVFGHNFGRNARSYFIDMKAEKAWNKSKVINQIVHRAFQIWKSNFEIKCINMHCFRIKTPQNKKPTTTNHWGFWVVEWDKNRKTHYKSNRQNHAEGLKFRRYWSKAYLFRTPKGTVKTWHWGSRTIIVIVVRHLKQIRFDITSPLRVFSYPKRIQLDGFWTGTWN